MIKANFNTYGSYVTDSLYQWDINQVLTVTGLNLSTVPEVHFSNTSMDKAIVRQARRTVSNNVVGFSVDIPNSLLQDPLPIYAYIGIYEGDTFKVVEKVEIPVRYRVRPADYRFEDTDGEIYSYKALENQIANINETWINKNAEQVGEFVNAWLDNHPEATTTVQDGALTKSKFSDELKIWAVKDYVTPQMFGAKGDGVTDDTDAIQSAIDSMVEHQRLYFPSGEYLCSTITFNKNNCKIDFDGVLIQKDEITAPLLVVNANNVILNRPDVKRNCAATGIAYEDLVGTGIKIINSKNIHMFNPRSRNFALGLEIYSNNANGCAYIDVYNPFIVALVGIKATKDTADAWTNEVHVFGGRISIHETYTDYIGSAYCNLSGNAWRFNGVVMEGKRVERKITGDYSFSSFTACRFEQINDSGTDIDIFGSWNTFKDNYEIGIVVNDTGEGNDFDGYAAHYFGRTISKKCKTVSADDSLSWKYPIVFADASKSNITLTRGNANNAAIKGAEFTVKKIDSSANHVWVYLRPKNPDNGDNILLKEQYETITVISDGTGWYIKSWYKPSKS